MSLKREFKLLRKTLGRSLERRKNEGSANGPPRAEKMRV